MASTTFVNGVTIVDATWANDVNNLTYNGVGNAGYKYGTLSFTDTSILGQQIFAVAGPVKNLLQNTNATATANVSYVVSNNSGTATTFYGAYGINSSGYTGSGSFNLPNITYLYSISADLVLGTKSANGFRVVLNNRATDELTWSYTATGSIAQYKCGVATAESAWGVAGAGTFTVDCSLSNVFSVTLAANVTGPNFVITNPTNGQTINLFITQDATGSRTLGWPTSFKWPGGSVGTISTAANAVDLLVATYRTSTASWHVQLTKGFA